MIYIGEDNICFRFAHSLLSNLYVKWSSFIALEVKKRVPQSCGFQCCIRAP